MAAAVVTMVLRCCVLAPVTFIGICVASWETESMRHSNSDLRHRTDDYRIYIAGLIPMTSFPSLGKDQLTDGVTEAIVLPSIELAIEHVNNNSAILPGHVLVLAWNDTKCDMAVGSQVFFDMMHNPPAKAIILGDSCSHVTVPVAESAIGWNIFQLSYGDTNPILSDRIKYPNFYRTVPSDVDFNLARIHLLEHYQWNRVGTLFQDASSRSSRHAYMHNKLLELLDNRQIHRITESFSTDPNSSLALIKSNGVSTFSTANLLSESIGVRDGLSDIAINVIIKEELIFIIENQKDVRIVLGDFDVEMARKVFCAAFERKMYGAKYQWILAAKYPDGWWTVDSRHSNVNCTPSQLKQALEGYISTDILVLSRSNERTISSQTPSEYLRHYERRRAAFNYPSTKFHGYAYDAVWAAALAIDDVIRQKDGRYDVTDFHDTRFHAALNRTDFVGVTGQVMFRNGDRLGGVILEQFQDGVMVPIGQLNTLTNALNMSDKNAIKWAGGSPPRDRSHRVEQRIAVDIVIYVVVSCLAALGIILCTFFFVINVRFRHHRYIKMSSPNMNNIILTGCTLTYSSVFLLGVDGRVINEKAFAIVCSLNTWVFCIGFTLSFGAMFSKTWRVHSIFTNIQLNKKVIKDYKLIVIVNLLLVIDLIILITWQVIDPPFQTKKELPQQVDVEKSELAGNSLDVDIVLYVEYCSSQRLTIWLSAIYIYKGLLLVVGCFLAWETRNVSIAALNDSKYIGMSVYNVVITCAAGVPVTLLVGDRPVASFLIIAMFVIFSTTTTLCLVFGPKLLEIRRDPRGQQKRSLKTFRKQTVSLRDSRETNHRRKSDLSVENQTLRELLDKRQQEIDKLLVQLSQAETGDDVAMFDVTDDITVSPTMSTGVPADEDVDRMRHLATTSDKQKHGAFTFRATFSRLRDGWPPDQSQRNHAVDDVIRSSHIASCLIQRPTNNIELSELSIRSRDDRKSVSVTVSHHVTSVHHVSVATVPPNEESSLLDYVGNTTMAILNDNISDDSRSFTGVKTPSYQGLKFLADLLQLKETAILSDSESEELVSPQERASTTVHCTKYGNGRDVIRTVLQ